MQEDVVTTGLRPIEKGLCAATIYEEPHKIYRAIWDNVFINGGVVNRRVVVYCRYCGYTNDPAVPGVDI